MQFDHLLTQTCTVIDVVGRTSGGDPSFGFPRTQVCRYERYDRRVRAADGDFHETKNRIATNQRIAIGSLVFPPGVDTSDRNNALPVKYCNEASTPPGSDTLFEVYL